MEETKNNGLNAGVLITLIIAILVATGGFIFINREDSDAETQPTPTPIETVTEDLNTDDNKISYSGQDEQTALDLLKDKVENVVTQDSDLGEYVVSINGIKSGENGKYWMFYVNGTPAQIGAGDFTTASGDTIEWRFE